jgi:hypothetical protein
MNVKDFTPVERHRIALALSYEADRLNEIAKSYEKDSPERQKYVDRREQTSRLEKRF